MTWKDPAPKYDPEGETRPMPPDSGEEATRPMPTWEPQPGPSRPAGPNPSQPGPIRWVDPPQPSGPVRLEQQPRQVPPGGPSVPRGLPPAAPRPTAPRDRPLPPGRRSSGCLGCFWLALIPGLLLVLAYFIAPVRTNLLLLGIDRAPEGTALGRSDTIVLMSVVPLKPDVNMLSIPRDLWVNVPGVGENRINTAHFFAENAEPGSGPAAAAETIRQNFNVPVHYTVRVRFDDFTGIVAAMGGVTVNLPEPMSGYPAGTHTLNPEQALAFARDRAGTDDFFRMERGQLLLLSAARQMLSPAMWPRLPAVFSAALDAMDTDLPVWLWPRLGLALLRAGPDGIDHRTLTREMVNPFTTDGGAQVLGPNWEAINPLVDELFR